MVGNIRLINSQLNSTPDTHCRTYEYSPNIKSVYCRYMNYYHITWIIITSMLNIWQNNFAKRDSFIEYITSCNKLQVWVGVFQEGMTMCNTSDWRSESVSSFLLVVVSLGQFLLVSKHHERDWRDTNSNGEMILLLFLPSIIFVIPRVWNKMTRIQIYYIFVYQNKNRKHGL